MLDNKALVLDLVSWIGAGPKAYDDVMAAWRTSCPRLSIWEDAVDRGLLVREYRDRIAIVRITESGLDFLGAQERV